MAHKTRVGGTAYEISGGKTLVNGTAYSIKNGKALVDGAAYELGFSNLPVITIVVAGIGAGAGTNNNNASINIDGTVYSTTDEKGTRKVEVEQGTIITCSAIKKSMTSTAATIKVNGSTVAQTGTSMMSRLTTTYEYTVTGDAKITLTDSSFYGTIEIVEE